MTQGALCLCVFGSSMALAMLEVAAQIRYEVTREVLPASDGSKWGAIISRAFSVAVFLSEGGDAVFFSQKR